MKATLETLTPVHIGNGTTYNKNVDFIQVGNKIGIIDEKKVLQFIGEENIHQWVSAIEKGGDEFLSLMKGRGFNDKDIEAICMRTCGLAARNNQSTQLKEHFRTALKGITIPGSSLKGAMKTALWDDLASQDNFAFDIGKLKFERRNHPNLIVWKDAEVEKELFGNTANEKSTRFLKIGDMSFPDCSSEVHEIRILNIENGEWTFKKGQHFLAETIPAGARTDFRFSIDESLLEKNIEKYPELWPKYKVDFFTGGYKRLCEKMNSFTTSLIEWEFDLLENEDLPYQGVEMLDLYEKVLGEIEKCNEDEFIIRIGANCGWIFMTGGWWRRFTEDISEGDLTAVRKAIQKKYYDMEFWPKTRKISSSGQIFGFVKIIPRTD